MEGSFMGWSVGEFNGRDIGYGVPAICDHPKCGVKIDRGLSYVCGGQPYGGKLGCGLFFCSEHLGYSEDEYVTDQLCERCLNPDKDGNVWPFEETPDIPEWLNHKLTDESWGRWRKENPDEVAEAYKQLEAQQS